MSIKLSVIIPVYNSIKYIEECVSSIVDSKIDGMEIILVDDGSKDTSYELCCILASNDSRITVYHKENGGSASARNYGLDRANGDYVTFIDSDDAVDPEEYRAAFDETLSNDYDIGCFNLLIGNETISCKPCESIWQQFISYPIYMHSLCNKFFKRSAIKDFRLDEDLIVCEDMLFCAKAFIRSGKIGYIDRTAYRYRMLERSVTHATHNDRKYDDDIEAAKRLREFYSDNEDKDFVRFLNFRRVYGALRYLTEFDVYDPEKYRACKVDKSSYSDLESKKHRLLCWAADNHLDLIPNIHMWIKKRFSNPTQYPS